MSRLLIKDGAQPWPLLNLIATAQRVAADLGFESITITECMGGVHMATSLHYALRAIDIRSKDMPDADAFLAKYTVALGPGHDVLIEMKGDPNEHIHAEYDPK